MQRLSPLVSVLMPVHNGGHFLEKAVASILDQTLTDLELLIVDDHSTDQAIENLPSDCRIRVIESSSRGIISALNSGLAQARGKWLARMDADDFSLPARLRCQLDFLLQNPHIRIAGACVEMISESALEGGYRRYVQWLNALRQPGQIARELFIESPLPHPSWFLARRTAQQLGGYQDHSWAEDYDLLLRADAAGLAMGKPEEVLLQWREHPQRLTRQDGRYALERFTAAKAHYLAANRIGDRPVWIWGAGPSGQQMHDALLSSGVQVHGFLEVHPRRIGGLKRNLPVLHFEQLAGIPQALVLVAVGVPKARIEIRQFMQQHNRHEGVDFLFVA